MVKGGDWLERIKEWKYVKVFTQRLRTPIRHVKQFLDKNQKDNVSAMAGQSAFFVILSAIPFALFAFSILSLVNNGTPSQELLSAAQPNDTADVIRQFIIEGYQHASGTISVTVIVALWSAGKGLYIITDGISRIYGLPQKHMWLLRRIFAMGYTLVLFLMMVLSLALMVLNYVAEQYISNAVGDFPMSTEILFGLRYIIMAIILTLSLTLTMKLYLFRKVEDRRFAKFRVLLPGMAFTAVAWMLLIRGVEFYTTHFSSSVYGSLGTVVVAMMWVYFTMFILLCGIQINFIYRERFYRFSLKKLLKKLFKK